MTKYKKYKKLVQIREDPVVLIRGHLSRGKPLTKEGWSWSEGEGEFSLLIVWEATHVFTFF